jgi:DNA-3-methyladenine glycosylase II
MNMPSRAKLKKACEALSVSDPALGRAYDSVGIPSWRTRAPCYESLASMIAYQQISTAAAATIWGRAKARLGDVTPDAVLALAPEDLTACGLSRPKVSHLRSIAEAAASGRLDFTRLAKSDLDTARAELLAVKGIGPWTADLFLMTALGELDAFPAGDVGLMEAYRMLQNKKKRMESKAFSKRAERWRPYRGVATHLLWGYINQSRAKATQGG